MEHVESKENPLIQIVREHQHHTNSTSVRNFKTSFQDGTKQIKIQ